MQNIFVRKEKLLEILEKNLEIHKKLYEEAKILYKEKVIATLEKKLENAKKEKINLDFYELVSPQTYSQSYKDAIRMIKLNCKDEVQLSEKDFQNYVLNKWDWISTFRHSYMSNSVSSSSSSSVSSDELNLYFGDE